MREFYRLTRLLWPLVAPPLGAITLAKTFNVTIHDIIKYYQPVLSFIFSVNIPYLLVTVLIVYFTYVKIRHRHTLLSVLSTDINIMIDTQSGDRATIGVTQRIRAYREDITGYHRAIWATSPGRIPRESIEFDINHCSRDEQRIHFDGDPTKWDIIHRFTSIPRNLLMLGLNTVQRTEILVHENTFIDDLNWYELLIPEHYRHKRITITVFFHPARECSFDDCEAIRISANGIIDMRLQSVPPEQQSRRGIRLKVKNPLPGERYRIIWKHTN